MKTARFSLLIPVFSCLVLLAAGAASHAEETVAIPEKPKLPVYAVQKANKRDLVYNIYAGGFEAMDAGLVLDLAPDHYDVALTAKTKGFIGTVFPWSGEYKTSGHAAPHASALPTRTLSKSVWRNNMKTTEMDYAPDGTLKKSTQVENGQSTVTRDFAPELAKDAVDMLTATLMMIETVEASDACKGSFPVFDGKRRFNITLQDAGTTTIKESKYSIFAGEAIRCTLKVEPVAGFRKKDMKRGWMAVQNHTEGYKKPPTLWFARQTDGGPVIPVRMEIASEYGAVIAHLAESK